MLILSRKPGQKIYIGDDIVIHVSGVHKGHNVNLCIDAPKHIPIHRDDAKVKVPKKGKQT